MGVVLLVRHGQADFDTDAGQLTELGRRQSEALGRSLASTHGPDEFASLISGTLKRHVQTIDGVQSGGVKSADVIADERWNEFDVAGLVIEWLATKGRPVSGFHDKNTFFEAYDQATSAWIDGELRDGEPWPDFARRIDEAFDEACERAVSHQWILVVSSGGAIARTLSRVLADGDETVARGLWTKMSRPLVNTGISSIGIGRYGPQLVAYNQQSHLFPDLRSHR